MISRSGQIEGFILLCMPDIFQFHIRQYLLFPPALCTGLPIFIQYPDQIFLFIISKHDINTGIHFSLLCLHITSRCNNHCIRIHFPCPVQHLTGLSVCNIRHGTGVDHIDICPLFKRDNLISGLFQHFLHSLSFICIYLASKVVQCSFF